MQFIGYDKTTGQDVTEVFEAEDEKQARKKLRDGYREMIGKPTGAARRRGDTVSWLPGFDERFGVRAVR